MIKRILAALFAIIFLFSFASCNDETSFWESERTHVGISGGETWYFDPEIYIIDCYYNAIESPFVNYKQISFLGALESWAILGQYSGVYCLNAYGDYGNMIDSDYRDFEIELFYKKTEHELLPPEEESYYGMSPIDISVVDRATGMRKLLEGYYGGFIDVDGVRYIYTHGTLQGIKWVHAGCEFTLYVPEVYPVQFTESFAAKMMDPALAPAARDAFNRAFDACTEVVR